MTVFFMNEKNPRVSNREERGWRRRPTPSPGSGPAGREQPPGERRPERPLRSRSFPLSRGGAGRRGRRGPAPAGGLWPPPKGSSTLPFQFLATALEGSATPPPAPAANPRPGLHQLPATPAPPFPLPPSSPSFLSGRSLIRPGPASSFQGRPGFPGEGRGCWAAVQGLGPFLTL